MIARDARQPGETGNFLPPAGMDGRRRKAAEPERDDPYIEEPCGMCNATGLVSFWGSLPDDRQEPVVVCYFCEGTKVMLVENPLYLPF